MTYKYFRSNENIVINNTGPGIVNTEEDSQPNAPKHFVSSPRSSSSSFLSRFPHCINISLITNNIFRMKPEDNKPKETRQRWI